MIYKIVLCTFLLGLLSFMPAKEPSITDPSVVGKWHSVGGFRYERGVNEATGSSWYEFKKNGRVYFSQCTDACGCMRKTLKGRFTQKSMSIVEITFFKKKSEYSRNRGYSKMNEIRMQQYTVRRMDKNVLVIHPVPVKSV
jgi:hypothetical protein